MKAVKVTEDNYLALSNQYQIDDPDDVKDAIGLYLIADFGQGLEVSYIKKEDLDKSFVVGEKLLNEYFEITRRNPHTD